MKQIKMARLIIASLFILLILTATGALYLYILGNILLTTLMVILTIFVMIVLYGLIQKTIFIGSVLNIAKELGFRYKTGFNDQPKIFGRFEGEDIELHYRFKYGEFSAVERTYVKLMIPMDEEPGDMKRYMKLPGFNILSISTIKRPDKKYILMRVYGYIMDTNRLKTLMRHLISSSQKNRQASGSPEAT